MRLRPAARPRRSCSTTPRMWSTRSSCKLFDRLIERAAVIQLPVLPLPDPNSRWISGHYCDEFAEAHIKELVVREAVGAAIPLAGVGCAIARGRSPQLAAMQDGRPFAGGSMTEDYEIGLRIGALGSRRCSCASRRGPATAASSPAAAISRRRSALRSARKRAGSAASRLPAGTGSAGAAGSASAGCGFATGAARLPRCSCSPPMAPRCCGRRSGWPKRSARRSRRGSTRRWSPC